MGASFKGVELPLITDDESRTNEQPAGVGLARGDECRRDSAPMDTCLLRGSPGGDEATCAAYGFPKDCWMSDWVRGKRGDEGMI